MRPSPSALLSLCNSSTISSSTLKHSKHPHSSRTFWLVASLMVCLFVIASPLLAQQPPVLVTQTVDNSVRTVLPGNVHPLARAEFDQGEAPPDLVLHRMLLVLKHSAQQETAMRRLIENQQYKKSSSYHQWLTPVEFGAQFGPAESDIAAVTNWLQASGFQVSPVSNGRTVIEFSGTAGQVKQAFGTAIHKYVVKGEEHWANVSNPSIPTALAPVIAGVNSLNGFPRKAQNIYVGTYSEKTKQLTSPNPEFTLACGPGNADTCYALGPYDFATIYDVLPLWTAAPPINGTGQTIAIVGDSDINKDDAPAFWSLFGLDGVHAPQPTLNIIYNGPNPGFNGDESEADIDTQWSGAVAPGATIDFVTSEGTETDFGFDLSALYIVDNNLAPIMSESYGICEAAIGKAGVNFYGAMWAQAAAQGISVMVSAGDAGSAGCDDFNSNSPAQYGLAVSGFASTPYNVAVGGTDFNQYNNWSTYWNSSNAATTQESAKSYIPETSWNDSCTNAIWVTLGWGANAEAVCNNSKLDDLAPTGGSGGPSAAWVNFKPAWQTGTGVPNDNTRDLPDISLFASNGFMGSFYVICQSDLPSVGGTCTLENLPGFGGTSVSSPAFAGIMALVNQKMGSAVGNPNFVLYDLVSKQPTAFHNVPAGSTNAMPCKSTSPNCVTNVQGDAVGVLSGYNTTTAYDLVTGLGSVDAALLVNNWNKVTFTPTTTALTLNSGNPVNVTHGTAVTVAVSVTSSSATGDVALLVSPGTSGATPPNQEIDWNSLGPPAYPSGTATWPTTLLPGGTYQVIAHYEGDTTYGGSYSSPSASITVTQEASSVSMPGVVTQSGVSNSVVYGTGASDLYLLRADVLNSLGKLCNPSASGNPPPFGPPYSACPTGTISFTDNGSALDASPYTLNSYGYTEDQAIQLTGTGSPHTLVANYSGDNSYKASTSPNAVVTVTPAPTTIANVAISQTPVTTGQTFTVTATVTTSSYGVAPTGTVKFFYSGTLLGTAQTTGTNGSPSLGTLASLAASLNTSISTAGSYNITATYTSGDANYASQSSSNSVPITVTNPSTAFTWTVPVSTATVLSGQIATYNFTATPTVPLGNAITFSCSGLPDATVTCSFVPTTIAAGTSAATPVQVSITTTGPNSAAGKPQRRADNRSPWLPLALPLAGIVMVGFAGRKVSKYSAIAGLCVSLALLGLLIACGGGSSAPPPAIGVTVSQGTPPSVFPNNTGWPAQTAQFTATVTNTSNTAVTWAVTTAGGGSIDANGKYTAPTVAAGLPPTVTITATSAADTTKFGSAQETLKPATIPGTYTNIMVTATEGTIVNSDPVTLTVQ